MPIYEYKCESCGKIFTKIQKFADEPLTTHEECGSGPVERLISRPAFHFKGTGWYVTDYAKSSASNPSGEGKPPSGEGKSEGDKGETKSAESKPAETKTTSSDSSSTPAKSESKPAPSGS